MRPSRLLAAVLVSGLAVAALSACGDAPLPAQPSTVDARSTTRLDRHERPTRAPALTKAATSGLESTPWELVHASGREITIRYVAGGGCSAFKGVRVEETAKQVELWTAVQTDRGPQACAAYLAMGATTIRLKSSLADRTLLHAPVSDHWRTYINNF